MQEFPAVEQQQKENTGHICPILIKMVLVEMLDDPDGHGQHKSKDDEADNRFA